MNLFWGTIIITHMVSLIFMGLALLRYFAYKKRNTIIENRYSMLMGFIRPDHVVMIYVGFVLLYTVGSMMFIFYLSSL